MWAPAWELVLGFTKVGTEVVGTMRAKEWIYRTEVSIEIDIFANTYSGLCCLRPSSIVVALQRLWVYGFA